jgi:hypothetical protein
MNDHPAHYNAAMEALIQRAKDPVTGRTVQSKMKVVAGTVNRGNPKRRVGKPKFGEQKTKAVALDVIDEGKTWDQVRAEHGVSATIIRTAVAKEEGRREALQEAYLDPQTLSRSAQEKLQAAIRQEQRRLEAEFERRVQDEIKKRLDELVMPAWLKKLADADRVIKSRKGVMPRAEYRLIAAALHPDQSMSKERMHEAFLAFTKHELPLVAEKELPISQAPMPRNYEELMRMRAEMQAKRRKSSSNGVQQKP